MSDIAGLLTTLEEVYRDIHSHPELSMLETRTAGLAADHLREAGFNVTTCVGKTGVVGIIKNGHGPTVMLRADMDALPMKEETGLSYASTAVATNRAGEKVPVAHACGHDMHITWLIGAARILADTQNTWQGTLLVVFQPGEETAEGAQSMFDDNFLERFPRPDVVLGQHVVPAPAGILSGRAGVTMAAADSLQIKMFGRGGHGSMPQNTVDPVVMAAGTVMRLQTIVSRELGTGEPAVVTVGVLQAGTKENISPDEALIRLNIRSFDGGVRKRVLDAVKRIVKAEANVAGATRPPEITVLDSYAMVVNDSTASRRVRDAFETYFPEEQVLETQPSSASEDFGCFGSQWHAPSVFWFVGGTDPELFEKARKAKRLTDLPCNHNPRFAPVVHPTLQTGIEALGTFCGIGGLALSRSTGLQIEQVAHVIMADCQRGIMVQTAEIRLRRESAMLYRRIEAKLGITSLRSDRDLARLVHERLPLASVEWLSHHGMSDEEIYSFIVPRRTLVHRKTRSEPLTHDESDRAVRVARSTSVAEEVFGDDAKAARWLRKAKSRFEGRSPLEMLRTEAGARLVEEMLLQLDYGFAA